MPFFPVGWESFPVPMPSFKMNSAYHNCDHDIRLTPAEAESLRSYLESRADDRIAHQYQSGVNDENYTIGWYDATADILQDYVYCFSDFESLLWREEVDKRFSDRIKFYIKTWSYAYGEFAEDLMGFRRSVNKKGETCWVTIDSKYDWMEFDALAFSDRDNSKDTADLFFIHIPTLFEVVVDRLNDKWAEEKEKAYYEIQQPEEPTPPTVVPVKIPPKVVKKKAIRKETDEEFSKNIHLKISEYNEMLGEMCRGK